ncbi:hypothetical protein AS159_07640 [Thermotoga sp. Ku-13t]|uniref:hypothetical protein n=1 Tax=Thermotoga sp. Ku-13t TaxID=1755813 RepID=UPI0013ED9705|nr:hypothetical protein [Thermotoga sp. Ku-13t]KAF2957528.1 hypothetical protein AS159_07640 [Thermotoga sp. Ku-13t]
MNDLAGLIRSSFARISMIEHHEEIVPEDVRFGPSSWIVESGEAVAREELNRVVFVDSRRRRFASIEVEGYVLLISQIVTGAVLLENDRCKPLFSSEEPPVVKLVLGVPDPIAALWELSKGEQVTIGNLICDVAVGPTAEDATDSYMQDVERETVERYVEDYLVVKDGVINFQSPTFKPGRGPLGLVKNIHIPYVDPEKFKAFGLMKKGQRSRCIATELGKGGELLKVMSYLKLSNIPGLRGLVRIETVVHKDELSAVKEDIFKLFEAISHTLTRVSDDTGLIPRTPEDTLPVVFLEKYLDRYFYNETYVKCALLEAIRS